MDDLLAIDSCRPPGSWVPPSSLAISRTATPLKAEKWEEALASYPDKRFTQYILSGIREGFRIGFDYQSFASNLRPTSRNMRSAYENAQVIQEYITEELATGRIAQVDRPAPSPAPSPRVHASPFGVIPKKSSPGKWRLIVDLSSPTGGSVNDGIAQPLCSLSYPTVHDAAKLAQALGRGSLLAKLDLQHAYRIVPVHPEDCWLLGMQWEGRTFVDGALPFGLRSAPKIFTALADALQWIMEREGVTMVIHYLDDFLFLGPPHSLVCAHDLNLALSICARLGVPVAPKKTEGPSPHLVFLGITIDTENTTISLPASKLQALRAECKKWAGRSNITKSELQSLLGSLNHAASVVGPGRTFMRGLIGRLPLARGPGLNITTSGWMPRPELTYSGGACLPTGGMA